MHSQQNNTPDEQALNGTFKKFKRQPSATVKYDPMAFLQDQYEYINNLISHHLEQSPLKWYISMKVKFIRNNTDVDVTVTPGFRSKLQMTLLPSEINQSLRESIKQVLNNYLDYQRQGSNWKLDHIIELTIHLAKYRPIGGSTYIRLPDKLRNKKACLNVENNDNMCFKWALLSAIHPAPKKDNPKRLSNYKPYEEELNFDGIDFPVKMEDIEKFEKHNNISITLLGWEDNQPFPLRIPQHEV